MTVSNKTDGDRSGPETVAVGGMGTATTDAVETEPEQSIWPCVAAAGLTAALFGLVTGSVLFVFVGAAGLILGVGGWVGELGRGGSEDHGHEAGG